jgi:hypothetical protein
VTTGGPQQALQCSYAVITTTTARVDCTSSFIGTYTTINWASPESVPTNSGNANAKQYSTIKTGAGLVNISSTVCNGSACNSVAVQVNVQPVNTSVSLSVIDTSSFLRDAGSRSAAPGANLQSPTLTLSALVSPDVNAGTVSFYQSGPVLLTTVPVDSTGHAVASGYPTTGIYFAVYNPPPNSLWKTSRSTDVHLKTSANFGIFMPLPAACGPGAGRVTIEVNTDAGPTATGTVTVTFTPAAGVPQLLATLTLDSSGAASFVWIFPTGSIGTIRADYSGDFNYFAEFDTRSWNSSFCP